MTSQPDRSERFLELVQQIADTFKDYVAETEASIPTTRNHYGDYMGLMLRFADDAGQRAILAKALVKAGANKQGVADALKAAT